MGFYGSVNTEELKGEALFVLLLDGGSGGLNVSVRCQVPEGTTGLKLVPARIEPAGELALQLMGWSGPIGEGWHEATAHYQSSHGEAPKVVVVKSATQSISLPVHIIAQEDRASA